MLSEQQQAMLFLGSTCVSQSSIEPLIIPSISDLNLANDPVFLDAALQYPEGIFKAAEALRYVPEFLAPYIVKLKRKSTKLTLGRSMVSWITRRHRASRILVATLTPIVEKRVGQRALRNPPPLKAVRAKHLYPTFILKKGLTKIERLPSVDH